MNVAAFVYDQCRNWANVIHSIKNNSDNAASSQRWVLGDASSLPSAMGSDDK